MHHQIKRIQSFSQNCIIQMFFSKVLRGLVFCYPLALDLSGLFKSIKYVNLGLAYQDWFRRFGVTENKFPSKNLNNPCRICDEFFLNNVYISFQTIYFNISNVLGFLM